jgi:hypothetical protein
MAEMFFSKNECAILLRRELDGLEKSLKHKTDIFSELYFLFFSSWEKISAYHTARADLLVEISKNKGWIEGFS